MNNENKKEVSSSESKLAASLEKNRIPLVCTFVVVLAALVVFTLVEVIGSKQTEKNLSKIDSISFALTDSSDGLEDDELEARRAEALSSLEPFVKKGGIAGVRANMLCAEILYQQDKYADALVYWERTAAKGKKSYTAPIAYYNIGVCNEQIGKLDAAADSYRKAAEADFVLASHAGFSYGRVLESQGKYDEAFSAYQDLNDRNPDDTWANIAKTRMIALQTEGKVKSE